jgi:predicted NUDIX family NTP pyrophosphohydrolase
MDIDAGTIASNTFEIEWHPKSGRLQTFPEVDRAGWFNLPAAHVKIIESQRLLLDRLMDRGEDLRS